MRRIVLAAATAATLFTGCANNGLAVNTIDNNKVDRYFHRGKIISEKKCVIDDRMTATLTGAGVGAVGGAALNHNAKGGLIGAAVGGLIGAVVGKEITAYEIIIKDEKGQAHKGYLKQKIPLNSEVEFTIVNGKLKNVNLLKIAKAQEANQRQETDIKSQTAHSLILQPKKELPKPQPIIVKKVKGVITKRQKVGNKWNYKLVTLNHRVYLFNSPNKYPYLRDLVKMSIAQNNTIAKIKLIKREQLSLVESKKIQPAEPKKTTPEKPKSQPKQVVKTTTTTTTTKTETKKTEEKSVW